MPSAHAVQPSISHSALFGRAVSGVDNGLGIGPMNWRPMISCLMVVVEGSAKSDLAVSHSISLTKNMAG